MLRPFQDQGLTKPQFQQLVAFLDKHVDEKGFLPGWLAYNGKTCLQDRINFYHFVKYVVREGAEDARTCAAPVQ